MTEPSYGQLIKGSKGLNCDGLTRYIFPDDTPYAGLNFVISPNLVGTDYADLYISPGSEAFELKLDTGEDWSPTGSVCAISDTLSDQESIDIDVRANPQSANQFPTDGPTEGLLQIIGEEETNLTIFAKTNITTKDLEGPAIRLIIPEFIVVGTQVRFQFWVGDTALTVSDSYFGRLDQGASFLSGKVPILFGGANNYTGTTPFWSDWAAFNYDGSHLHLLSWTGGGGKQGLETEFYYYYNSTAGSSSTDLGATIRTDGYSLQETGLVGIIGMEIMITNFHITSIPLSAVVSRKFPTFTIEGNFMDEATADVLRDFGITAGEIS